MSQGPDKGGWNVWVLYYHLLDKKQIIRYELSMFQLQSYKIYRAGLAHENLQKESKCHCKISANPSDPLGKISEHTLPETKCYFQRHKCGRAYIPIMYFTTTLHWGFVIPWTPTFQLKTQWHQGAFTTFRSSVLTWSPQNRNSKWGQQRWVLQKQFVGLLLKTWNTFMSADIVKHITINSANILDN